MTMLGSLRSQSASGAALAVTALVVAGCSGSGKSSVGAFDAQGGKPVTCRTHQQHRPPANLHLGQGGDVEATLVVLHYFVVNNDTAYCDHKPPTATDRAWIAISDRHGVPIGTPSATDSP